MEYSVAVFLSTTPFLLIGTLFLFGNGVALFVTVSLIASSRLYSITRKDASAANYL
jgi:hypothetical protein